MLVHFEWLTFGLSLFLSLESFHYDINPGLVKEGLGWIGTQEIWVGIKALPPIWPWESCLGFVFHKCWTPNASIWSSGCWALLKVRALSFLYLNSPLAKWGWNTSLPDRGAIRIHSLMFILVFSKLVELLWCHRICFTTCAYICVWLTLSVEQFAVLYLWQALTKAAMYLYSVNS